jgi:hypothetical protein
MLEATAILYELRLTTALLGHNMLLFLSKDDMDMQLR